jgi:hypothetical protein
MSKTLDCPNCGASLDAIQPGSPTTKCNFCHSIVLLPVELLKTASSEFSGIMPDITPDHLQDINRIATLARSGSQLEAIKLFREVFDTSLAESKHAIEGIAAGQPVIMPDRLKPLSGTPSQTERLRHIADLHRNGNPIEAIRLFMDAYPASLKVSKDAVEQLAAGNLVSLPDGTVFQLLEGFTNLNPSLGIEETIRNKKKPGCGRSLVVILPAIGVLIGIIAALLAVLSGLPVENQPLWLKDLFAQPEALVAPFSTLTPTSTPTLIPFASQVFTFGGEGTGAGLFSDARYIGVDSQGGIYVGDIDTRLIQVFDSEGNYVTQWHTGKKDNGKDLFIAGMATDLNGQVYIAASDGIYIFNGHSGERLGILTYPGEGYFEDVTTAPDGSVLGVYFTDHENIVRFDKNGQVDLYLDNPIGNVTDHSELDTTVAVDGIGNIYLLGSFNNLVFIYNRDGKYQNRFGGDGEGPGTFQAVDTVAVDSQSRIYVSDIHGIQVFDPNGRFLETFEIQPSARGMCFDLKGNLYILTYQEIAMKYKINE